MKTWYRRAVGLGLALSLCGGVHLTTAAPARQGARIQYNEIVQGNISESTNEDDWEFDGHTGDLVLIDMRADGSDLDTYLTLLDPYGSPLVSDDDSGEGLNSRIGPYRLTSDGIYTILAGRYGGSGSYLLALKNLNTIPMLVPGKPLIGVVDSVHPTDYFLLATGEAGTLWRLDVSDDQSGSDPYLALYGSSGLLLSTEFEGGGSIDPVVSLPGETYVAVVSWNPYSPGGPYQLELHASDAELLDTGITQSGTLDYTVISQQHYFRGEEGQAVRLSVEVEGDVALALDVTTLDGSLTLFSSSGEMSRAITVTLDIPQTAVYAVEIWDGSYMGENGSYTVSLERVED
jgi:hypothetical protein